MSRVKQIYLPKKKRKNQKPENDYFRALELETHCYYL